jgi:hypothetical protein
MILRETCDQNMSQTVNEKVLKSSLVKKSLNDPSPSSSLLWFEQRKLKGNVTQFRFVKKKLVNVLSLRHNRSFLFDKLGPKKVRHIIELIQSVSPI